MIDTIKIRNISFLTLIMLVLVLFSSNAFAEDLLDLELVVNDKMGYGEEVICILSIDDVEKKVYILDGDTSYDFKTSVPFVEYVEFFCEDEIDSIGISVFFVDGTLAYEENIIQGQGVLVDKNKIDFGFESRSNYLTGRVVFAQDQVDNLGVKSNNSKYTEFVLGVVMLVLVALAGVAFHSSLIKK